ncbi:tail fiber protein [Burkholderia vietnamiensis]|uniref:tail fiber protein n=1 Tax=Burkholderia vietnamiensis TaxID=60552 RepID=UPI001CF3F909|nr:tail fiber protein [Burkholderia vietnamiensis]MCA8182504.1 tail fiber protein [Burkholderia vietnamiensis]
MEGTAIYLTDAGRAALVNSDNTGTTAHRVTEIGIGTEPFKFDKGMRVLPGERKRLITFGGKNVAEDTIHVAMQDATNDQYTMYAFGLYLESGVLAAVYVQPAPILEKSPAAQMLLSADIQFTEIDAANLVFGDATFLNPPATTEVQGVIEIATSVEVDAGVDAVRAVTPATLKPALARKANIAGDDFAGPVSVKRSVRVSDAPGSGVSGVHAGNGDGASATVANLAVRSWFGIGFAPEVDGMPVPKGEYSHWFDARTGNTGMRGSLTMRRARQAVISADTSFDGLTLEASDLDNKVKKPIALAPWGGRVFVGKTADDNIGLLQVAGPITAQTPPLGDASTRVPTTEWVVATVGAQSVGTIILEVRTTARAGCLKLNGAVIKRADYPALWAYAQASGALVSEADWGNGRFGCFSTGDGTTTFRIPEFRGEFPRFWDDGRGADSGRSIGSHQMFTNAWHAHGASAAAVGDHVHSAWTDGQGEHSHYVNDPGHAHQVPMGRVGVVATSYGQGWGPYNWDRQDVHGTWGSGTGIWLNNAGGHGHNVGIGGAGAHSHAISIGGDGGNEARPRNLALLAMIRAF